MRLTELSEAGHGSLPGESLVVGDSLVTEVARLEMLRDAWLDAPDEDCHGRTPRSVIDRERARLPESMAGEHAIVDPDCPCCQIVADMPGPMFWHLDGCNMDEDFAFHYRHRTREEWEKEQRESEECWRRFDERRSECERLGVAGPVSQRDDDGVWSRSSQAGKTEDVPVGVRLFTVGSHLAELIVDLRDGKEREATPQKAQRHIDQVNRDFGNMREILHATDRALAEALIGPVVERLAESLSEVATARADLAAKCESLIGELHRLLEPPAPERIGDSEDFDLPF
jgi:hypothetical protein